MSFTLLDAHRAIEPILGRPLNRSRGQGSSVPLRGNAVFKVVPSPFWHPIYIAARKVAFFWLFREADFHELFGDPERTREARAS